MDDWTHVRSKKSRKKKPRAKERKQDKNNMSQSSTVFTTQLTELESSPENVGSLVEYVTLELKRIKFMPFFAALCKSFSTALSSAPTHMVMYGIGPFSNAINDDASLTHKYTPGTQLAVALLLMEHFSCNTAIYHDPVMTELEVTTLKTLNSNIQILENNNRGVYCIDDLLQHKPDDCIMYMPHCPLALYSNVIWSNWSKLLLKRLFIFGNSFESYHFEADISPNASNACFYPLLPFMTELLQHKPDDCIMYMPHCPLALYSNVIWSNWSKLLLKRLFIFGNSFESYHFEADISPNASNACFYPLLPFMTELDVVLGVEFESAFWSSKIIYIHPDQQQEFEKKLVDAVGVGVGEDEGAGSSLLVRPSLPEPHLDTDELL